MTTTRIPAEFLPRDGRFGCGPAKVRPEQLDHVATWGPKLLGTSHRQAPVRDLVGRVRDGIARLFSLPEGYEVVLGNGGSTVFWDAAAVSLIADRAQLCSFGEFGAKFARAASAPWLTAPDVRSAPPGSLAEPAPTAGVDVYAWPQNETSTGTQAPVYRVRGLPDATGAGALTVIDATSAAGGVAVNLRACDVYYFAPQKNFGSDGGLWFAILSPAAIDRIVKIAATDRFQPEFLSLQLALTNARLNQTLNTPALTTLLLMENQLDWLNAQGGLAWADQRTRTSSGILYDWAARTPGVTPFVTDPAHRSQVVVTLDMDDAVDATALARTLRANGIVDVEPYRKLGRNQLRIATFVAIEPDDVRQLTRSLDYLLTG